MIRRRMLAAMLAAPIVARAAAQDSQRVRVVGYLIPGEGRPKNLAANLREFGYIEGRNLRLELRHVPEPATTEQLDRAAQELTRSGAEILVTQMAAPTAALHRATKKLPIVTYGVSNPVSLGLARSLRNPGMNVTGLSFGLEEGAVLQFGALRLLRPRLRRVVFLIPRADAFGDVLGRGVKHAPEHVAAAKGAGLVLDAALVSELGDFERTFAAIRDPTQEAAWIATNSMRSAKEVAALAIRHKVATHGLSPESVRDGLLVAGGLIQSDSHRRVATIIDKILRGADPGTIPFEQPDKTVMALNRATAAAIGVTIPEELQLRATEIFG